MTYLPELLVVMHAAAVELEASDNLLEHHWGLHLLSDWKSLMLLAETGADEPEPVLSHEGLTDRLMDGTPAR